LTEKEIEKMREYYIPSLEEYENAVKDIGKMNLTIEERFHFQVITKTFEQYYEKATKEVASMIYDNFNP
jgi:hypothetical protein